jgi:hypothetical protein
MWIVTVKSIKVAGEAGAQQQLQYVLVEGTHTVGRKNEAQTLKIVVRNDTGVSRIQGTLTVSGGYDPRNVQEKSVRAYSRCLLAGRFGCLLSRWWLVACARGTGPFASTAASIPRRAACARKQPRSADVVVGPANVCGSSLAFTSRLPDAQTLTWVNKGRYPSTISGNTVGTSASSAIEPGQVLSIGRNTVRDAVRVVG